MKSPSADLSLRRPPSVSIRVCQTCGRPEHEASFSSALTRKVGPWLLGKTVEFAIEKSVVYAIGALL